MAVIYKATNTINGKAYVGYSENLEKRKREHKRCGKYFHSAIKKYGEDAFEWQILKEDATLEDEIRLIAEHETFEKGYNLTKGGEGILGYSHSQETKQKLRKAGKGRKCSPLQLETLRRNAELMKVRGHSEEVKQRISSSHKGKVFSEEHKMNISKNHAAKKETGSFYQSSEYKEKMRTSCKGTLRTPEQKEKMRLAAIARWEKKRASQC
jgi:group I intron endonuclease